MGHALCHRQLQRLNNKKAASNKHQLQPIQTYQKTTIMMKKLHSVFTSLSFILVLLITAAGGFRANAATFYIDPDYTGSTQNGTIESPFKSWTSVIWNNGNTYLQKAGTTCNTNGSLVITSKNGITIGAYGNGSKPKLISSGGTSTKVIDITSCYNMIISGLEVASVSGQVTAAILIDGNGSANNLIEHCILRDVQWGIRILTTSAGNRILNCEVYNTQDDGIYIKDTPDIEIGYCNIYRVNLKYFVNPDQSYSAGDNIQIASTNSHHFNIHHNTLDHSYTGNKFCFIAWGNNYSGILEHNVMTGNRSQVTSCIYLSPTSGSVTMRYNSVKEGNYGVYAYVSDFRVYYNEFTGNKTALCVLNNYHLLAENNIFYNNINTAISGLSNSSVTSKNNIFFTAANAKAYSTNGTLTSNFNVFNKEFSGFINGHGTLNSWRANSGQDMNSLVSDPLFIDASTGNFMLQPQSPCINAATNCGYSIDYFGTSVPQGPSADIGYSEYMVTIVNNPPVINDQQFSIPENVTVNTAIGQVVATDPDGDNLSYQITGGTGQSVFSINETTGVITVADSTALDFEITQSFQLQVTVTDTEAATASCTVTINITDINEMPEIEDQGFIIEENSVSGTVIGQLTSSNPENYQVLTYSITSGNEDNAIVLDQATGILTVGNEEAFNFEMNQSMPFTIMVSDNGSPALHCNCLITLTLNNINECPNIAGGQYFEVNVNVPSGHLIGYVQASDPDENQDLSYSITNGNSYNAFTINPLSGALTSTANALHNHANQIVNLLIAVADNGNPQQTSSETIQVKVNRKFNTVKALVGNNVLGHVYPNPSNNGKFELAVNGAHLAQYALVQILNASGKVIKELSVPANGISEINITNEPNGFYIMEIMIGDKKETKKLIIQ